ncbi:MAG TPA: hypothetical protein GX707_14650 [Epulopiscium sp.]|nr:hypothetical protein [Candidatus Epulonipiscium sp.]
MGMVRKMVDAALGWLDISIWASLGLGAKGCPYGYIPANHCGGMCFDRTASGMGNPKDSMGGNSTRMRWGRHLSSTAMGWGMLCVT